MGAIGVFVAEDAPAVVMPTLQATMSPGFGVFHGDENGVIIFRLPGYDPENQLVTGHIMRFPQHGTLYQISENGSVGDALPAVSSFDAESLITQYPVEVVDMTSEWGTSSEWLHTANITAEDAVAMFTEARSASTNPLPMDCYCGLGILGPPDCPPRNGDCATTWSPSTNAGEVFITLRYAQAVYVSEVRRVLA